MNKAKCFHRMILFAVFLVCMLERAFPHEPWVHQHIVVQAWELFKQQYPLIQNSDMAAHVGTVGEESIFTSPYLEYDWARSSITSDKVETARWTRQQIAQDISGLSCNPAALARFKNDSSDIVDQLTSPTKNLRYAAAYVGMILKVWKPLLGEASHRNTLAGLVATLYSLGLTRHDGSLRLPHPQARVNRFGEAAQSFTIHLSWWTNSPNRDPSPAFCLTRLP